MWREDFAVADVANWGSTFTLEAGTHQRIVSQAGEGNATGSTGAWYKYNAGKMASDNHRIDVGIVTPPNGTLNTGVAVFFRLRVPDTFATAGAAGTCVVLGIASSGNWSIQSVNQTTFTSRATGTGAGFTAGDQISFECIGTLYRGLRNNVPIPSCTWTDASNTVASVGATKRNWGVIAQCLATNQQHYGIDWMNAEDLSSRFFAA